MSESNDLLKVSEVMRRLRTSRSTLYRAIKNDQLPAFFVGGTLRIRESDVAAFVKPAIKPKERGR